ncbi:guanine nucleotide-binding protein subunit beta [Acrasis kona]|uniref:Guanine nucleotide-binding protein subunit beta n=1 Tax=Acrasis kona TaxID=1008807 RepID=A0AAW2Z974_9EUKA
MATSVQQAITLAKEDSNRLKDQIKKIREETDDAKLGDFQSSLKYPTATTNFKTRKVLTGHGSKIYSAAWSSDSTRLVSASQDGRLVIWEPYTETKVQMISLTSCWVMCVGYSGSGNLVGSGGLDNVCTLHSTRQEGRVVRELNAHTGYLSCCKFIGTGDDRVLTSSGDMSCIVWDVDQGRPIEKFTAHTGDVMSVCISPTSQDTFVSASVDCTSRVWDIRSGKCVQIFQGHEGDINTVDFLPNGMGFATGSDDSSIRLFDLRANRHLVTYVDESLRTGVTSTCFSHSGRYLFASYDDGGVIVWDTIGARSLQNLVGHENRVSSLSISPNGHALCTASWDKTLRIWA